MPHPITAVFMFHLILALCSRCTLCRFAYSICYFFILQALSPIIFVHCNNFYSTRLSVCYALYSFRNLLSYCLLCSNCTVSKIQFRTLIDNEQLSTVQSLHSRESYNAKHKISGVCLVLCSDCTATD